MYLDLVTLPTVVRNAKGDFMRGNGRGERVPSMFRAEWASRIVTINPASHFLPWAIGKIESLGDLEQH